MDTTAHSSVFTCIRYGLEEMMPLKHRHPFVYRNIVTLNEEAVRQGKDHHDDWNWESKIRNTKLDGVALRNKKYARLIVV